MKARVFIGSSREGIRIAEAVQVLLNEEYEVEIWSQGIFGLSQGTLESLESSLDDFDFAILVLTPDDMTTLREMTLASPRDNVLFELGFFMGGLGRRRTFIVCQADIEIRMPTDLAGITVSRFQLHANNNYIASLGATATRVKNEMQRLGISNQRKLKNIDSVTDKFELTNERMQKLIELIAKSRKVELETIVNQFGNRMDPNHLSMLKKDLDDLNRIV